MGKKFGNLNRIVGITYYSLSPHEQKALKGVLNPGFWNTMRRTRESFFLVLVPILAIYGITTSAYEYHYKINRKNPKDFEHDE